MIVLYISCHVYDKHFSDALFWMIKHNALTSHAVYSRAIRLLQIPSFYESIGMCRKKIERRQNWWTIAYPRLYAVKVIKPQNALELYIRSLRLLKSAENNTLAACGCSVAIIAAVSNPPLACCALSLVLLGDSCDGQEWEEKCSDSARILLLWS